MNRMTNTLDFQAQALTLRAERQRIIAGNIANADTPGYVARDMDFAAALREATGNQAAGSVMTGQMGTAPGQIGAAVLDGHVDSGQIPAPHQGAFYTLGLVGVGDTVDVVRSDHKVAVYQVDQVESVSKQHFPTNRVYATVPFAALRLITCGGDFDYEAHSYLNNVIIYAHLTSSHAQ